LRPSILLLAGLLGCSHATAPLGIQAPSAPRASIQRYIADYVSATDTLYAREADGKLEVVMRKRPYAVKPVRGDTFATPNGVRVVLDSATAHYGEFVLQRRPISAGIFRITPQKPVADLRAAALAAKPPETTDTTIASDMIDLQSLDTSIKYDIRYASNQNFMGEIFYTQPRAFMQRPAAMALLRAHEQLRKLGYGLLIHDAYRPWYVTKMFWDATPDSLRGFVADPSQGSRHNRGAAVDLTLYDMRTGEVIEMPSGYDEFSERAFPNYPGGTTRQRWHRDLLKRIMEAQGFTVNSNEWWHFDYEGWRKYPIGTATFEEILARRPHREAAQ
jgi:D-alanyl-D-alanine dipeptidase